MNNVFCICRYKIYMIRFYFVTSKSKTWINYLSPKSWQKKIVFYKSWESFKFKYLHFYCRHLLPVILLIYVIIFFSHEISVLGIINCNLSKFIFFSCIRIYNNIVYVSVLRFYALSLHIYMYTYQCMIGRSKYFFKYFMIEKNYILITVFPKFIIKNIIISE